MNAEEKKSTRPYRALFGSLIEKWGPAIQAVGAAIQAVGAIATVVATVAVAVVAFFIQQDITRQEVRRAAIDRSVALYDYLMNSTHIKELMALHADVQTILFEKEREPGSPIRYAFIASIFEATKNQNGKIYKNLILLFNDIESVAKCSRYDVDIRSDDGRIDFVKRVTDDSQPICDHETFRTLLFGPLSELFFTYRYFFYCHDDVRISYWNTIRKFEIMIADFVYNDYISTNQGDEILIFLDDRDKERAIIERLMKSDETNYYTLRVPPGGVYCVDFREKLSTELESSHAEPEPPSS